jgi:gas vesicle protein
MCEKCDHNNTQAFINGALFGAAVGAVLGILYAPDRGENTRGRLRSSGEKYWDKSRDVLEDVQYTLNKVEKNMQDFKEKTSPMVSELEEKMIPILKEVQAASGPVKQEFMEKISHLADEAEEKLKEEKKKYKKRFFDGVK